MYGVQAMNHQEMVETDGGSILYKAAEWAIGYLVGKLVDKHGADIANGTKTVLSNHGSHVGDNPIAFIY